MFSFFHKEKEFISCEWIEYGVHFSPRGLDHCCMYVPAAKDMGPAVPLKNGKYCINEFYKKKKQLKNRQRKGIISDKCKGCYVLQKKAWEDKKEFENVVLNLNYKCNADCIYCFSHKAKTYFNTKIKDVPVYEIMKDAIKKKLILRNCEIHLGGGEPALNYEFEDLIELFLNNDCNNLKIYTSGIIYSKGIEKAISKDACRVYISTDSANRELYKQIKNVDKHDEVWNNIKNYCNAQTKEGICVWLKYIIIPDINDKEEFISEFIDKVVESGAKAIVTDIERGWNDKNSKNEEQMKPIIKLLKFLITKAKEQNLEILHFPASVYALDTYKDFYNSI